MKSHLLIKYLVHLRAKQASGFTLIELIVVVVIIGLLSTIALPSFLNQADRARQAEGQSNIGAINRAQQAYKLEEGGFASTIPDLKIGIQDTENYDYEITTPNPNQQTIATATPLKNQGGVAGRVYVQLGQTYPVLCVGESNVVPNVSAVTSNANCPQQP